ncbi:hypothetical protein [Helicobacter bilis]|nr:hypothetical protein [Helicobacter bilis]
MANASTRQETNKTGKANQLFKIALWLFNVFTLFIVAYHKKG